MAVQQDQSWFFEAYTKNPRDLSVGGWDIKVGFVIHAETRADAEALVRNRFGPLFDEIIQLYRASLHPLGCKTHIIRR